LPDNVRLLVSSLLLVTLALCQDAVIPPLSSPIAGMRPADVHDTFSETHNGHIHEATDIMEPAGTPIHAVADGAIRKLFLSKPGGTTIYQFDETNTFCYYYAHLQSYAPGLTEGMHVHAGDVIGFVGSTGNAVATAPHLHFAVTKLDPAREYWKGASLNPYFALLDAARRPAQSK
jgi:murein DD-endopeptidase MepM/ murein hydrolase activator NlpD